MCRVFFASLTAVRITRLLWLTVVFLPLLTACHSPPPPAPVQLSGIAYYSMPWNVSLAQLPTESSTVWQQRLQQQLDAANRVLSTYQPDTEIMRFNSMPIGKPFVASALLWHGTGIAQDVSAATQGVYDITVGPLVELWGFGAGQAPAHVPSAAAIAEAKARVGWQYLQRLPDTHSLVRQRDIRVDLSSIGEGLGVDSLVQTLEASGVRDYLVSVAGTLRLRGHKASGEPWQIAVEEPDGSGRPHRLLRLSGAVAVSTSGSYRNQRVLDGVSYSHTLDPRTGWPVQHEGVSVTVVMPDSEAALADAWATALNALGPTVGYELASRRHIAAYYLLRKDGQLQERLTAEFRPLLAD